MKKRLFVYSVDAMVTEDIAYLLNKSESNFKKFYENCSGVESIRTIYPSITYPVHVTLQTGCYPDRSGVDANNLFTTPGDYVEWTWDYRNMKADNIFSAAKRAGYTTGAGDWPVTAYNPDIDFHLPEYWLAHPGETLRGTFMEMGTSASVADCMEKHAHLLPDTYWKTGKQNFAIEPNFDNFMIHVVCDMIREHNPEILFIHGSLLDAARHGNGIFCPAVYEALDQIDEWLGMLFDAYRDSGHFDDTNFVILSDHGQMDYVRHTRPNAMLVDRGLVQLNEEGEVKDWVIYGVSNGHTMSFYEKDPNDIDAHNRAFDVLKELADEGVWGFREVFTRQEAADRFHWDGSFAFAIEGDGYTSFQNSPLKPFSIDVPLKDYRMGKASHGYMPDKGPQPVFLVKGPDFKENKVLPRREIVDVAPTFARLLGITLKDAQGTPMIELLKE